MFLAFVTAIFIKNQKPAVAKSRNVVAKRSYLFKHEVRSEQRCILRLILLVKMEILA
jgi:hypothetical protein